MSKPNIRLKTALWSAGLRQRELADCLHVSESVVSDYIAGRRPVPPERRRAIAAFLGTTEEALFDDQPATTDDPAPASSVA